MRIEPVARALSISELGLGVDLDMHARTRLPYPHSPP